MKLRKKCQKMVRKDKNEARKSSIYAGFRALVVWFECRLSTKINFSFEIFLLFFEKEIDQTLQCW